LSSPLFDHLVMGVACDAAAIGLAAGAPMRRASRFL
jgi:hypothetical protein